MDPTFQRTAAKGSHVPLHSMVGGYRGLGGDYISRDQATTNVFWTYDGGRRCFGSMVNVFTFSVSPGSLGWVRLF